MDITDILALGLKLKASDIHLAADAPPLVRVDGDIFPIPGLPALSSGECKSLVYSLLSDAMRARFEEGLELDCSIAVSELGRFRVNVLVQRGNVEAVLRAVPSAIPAPEVLGLGPAILGLADLPRGLVLVTGPTGCGKSTTLACLVEQINRKYAKHVLTIEDPIEFVFPKRKALIRQREVGLDTRSFQAALREALREDPNVIVVGEMRDPETIALTLTAAETGHLCLSTLHTPDAAQTVDRIIDAFPAQHQPQIRMQLAGALRGVVSQLLLPRKGSRGRIAARGLMLGTTAIANLIREGKTHLIPNTIETGAAQGMFTIERALAELVRRGLIEPPEAAEAAAARGAVLA